MLVRLALVLVLLATAGVALLLTAAYRATQHVPAFYQAALVERPVEQKAAADQLERQVLELHNEARKPGRWEARFSQDQINGWLAADLPVKFPGALPEGVSAPRVAIEPGRMARPSSATRSAASWPSSATRPRPCSTPRSGP
jgi:hypothetical protein